VEVGDARGEEDTRRLGGGDSPAGEDAGEGEGEGRIGGEAGDLPLVHGTDPPAHRTPHTRMRAVVVEGGPARCAILP